MNEKVIILDEGARGGLVDRLARRAVTSRLDALRQGRIIFVENGIRRAVGSARHLREVEVQVHDPRFWSAVALRGSVGSGESYMQGWWTTDDLSALLAMIVSDDGANDGLDRGLARLGLPFLRLLHAFRRNTIAGSRKNIHKHYDLGNDFFALWLDPTLMYSSGVFSREDMTMEEASTCKLEMMAAKMDIKPGHRVLEIGTGWGSFAIHLARHHDCKVTTTTISQEQFDFARARIKTAGLEDRIEVLLRDYRELEGKYDRIGSIEMFEAVGDQYYDTFFKRCCELLEPDGLMVMQTITIGERHYERARREADFIKTFIFPGCCIPSLGAISKSIARSSDFDLNETEDIGQDYARTLRHWREEFHRAIPAVRKLGFDDVFIRMWEFYLCYCEAGFSERHTRNQQIVLARPGNRSPLRAHRSTSSR